MTTTSQNALGCGNCRPDFIAAFILGIALTVAAPGVQGQSSTVWAWEQNFTAVLVPPGLTNVVALAASPHQSCALNQNGTVVSWGDLLPGRDALAQALQPDTMLAFSQFATGEKYLINPHAVSPST